MTEAKQHFKVENFSVIILAAGDSSRLGSAKQLLPYTGKPLLQFTIDNAKQSGADRVIVVLGSRRQLIEHEINTEEIIIAENTEWESGIASSIKTGITVLKNDSPDTQAAILMVCDQPFADAKIIKGLIDKQISSGSAIVGSSYDGTRGTPALFHSSLFSELQSLQGDMGAKSLFKKYAEAASFVPFEKGGIDIDTREDYQNLTK